MATCTHMTAHTHKLQASKKQSSHKDQCSIAAIEFCKAAPRPFGVELALPLDNKVPIRTLHLDYALLVAWSIFLLHTSNKLRVTIVRIYFAKYYVHIYFAHLMAIVGQSPHAVFAPCVRAAKCPEEVPLSGALFAREAGEQKKLAAPSSALSVPAATPHAQNRVPRFLSVAPPTSVLGARRLTTRECLMAAVGEGGGAPSGEAAAQWMSDALGMARYALAHGEVPVGCVVVWRGQVIAKGCNEVNASRNASRHAEMVALDIMMRYCADGGLDFQDVCKNSVLYVTVEPCVMCSFALRLTSLVKIVFGCSNERFGGCGSVMDIHCMELGQPLEQTLCSFQEQSKSTLTLPPLEITSGVLKDDAIDLLQQFYEGENPTAPEGKLKTKKRSK